MRKRIFLIIAMAFFSLTSFTAGEVNNASINFTSNTLTPPEMVGYSPKDITAHEGETILFYAKCSGNPTPTPTAYKGKTQLPTKDNPRIKLITTSENCDIELIVIISDIIPEDAGQYQIKMTNSEGSCTKEFTLKVIPRDN